MISNLNLPANFPQILKEQKSSLTAKIYFYLHNKLVLFWFPFIYIIRKMSKTKKMQTEIVSPF